MSDWGTTTKQIADVVLTDGTTLAGELHLYARPTYPPGPETPLEMLNRGDVFFALTLDSDVTFIPKAQVVAVRCVDQVGLADPARTSAARVIQLDVVMQGGIEYHGRAALELPPSRSRALDYLNGPGIFFALEAEDGSWYLNKSQVRFVRPLD